MMDRVARVASACALVALAVIVLPAGRAEATFPGTDGRITFSSFTLSLDHAKIGTIDPDGSNRALLSGTQDHDYEATWSADGSTVALFHAGSRTQLMIVDAVSGTRTVVVGSRDLPPHTAFNFFYAAGPAFSPDGSTLAFCVIRDKKPHFGTYTVGVDGSNLTLVTGRHPRCVSDWSSTGRLVLSQSVHRPHIFTMDPDGSNVQQVRDLPYTRPAFLVTPSWSPDGSSLVFTAPVRKQPMNSEIWTMHADGSHLTQLTDTPHRAEQNAVYPPDGGSIAFSRASTRSPYSSVDLWTMPSSGGTGRRLTDTKKLYEYVTSWEPT